MIKHRTKIVGLPTKIVTIPLLDCSVDTIKKLEYYNPPRRGNTYPETHYSVLYYCEKENLYFPFDFPISQLYKKNRSKIIGNLSSKRPGVFSYSTSKFSASSNKLFVAYFENKLSTLFSVSKIADTYQDYIGTDKHIDSDLVISCGQDFTYEKPYTQLVLQPKLKGKHIGLRKKFADDPIITFYFDKNNPAVFRQVQELLVKKYKAVGERRWKSGKNGRKDWDGFYPLEIKDNFPTSHPNHLNEPIVWSYLYIRNTCSDIFNKHKKIRVNHGNSGTRNLGDLYTRSIGISIKSIEDAEDFLDEYYKYVKLVRPKQNIL